MIDISSLRQEYRDTPLSISSVDHSPFLQLEMWLEEAVRSEIPDPNAMVLATATVDAMPSCRVVLLKGLDAEGLRFYTNYGSRKANELEANPHAAINFLWPMLERQVCVEGTVRKCSRAQSEEYWNNRPKKNQIGSWTSHQGVEVEDRAELEQMFATTEQKFADDMIPCPDYWGGYVLTPHRFEFWQGRPCRMHDRVEYRLEQGVWVVRRIAP